MKIQSGCDSSRATREKHVSFLCVLGDSGSSTQPALVARAQALFVSCLTLVILPPQFYLIFPSC